MLFGCQLCTTSPPILLLPMVVAVDAQMYIINDLIIAAAMVIAQKNQCAWEALLKYIPQRRNTR